MLLSNNTHLKNASHAKHFAFNPPDVEAVNVIER